ncbi:MAG: MBL fold metallo-hydrolase [Symploca sp. SIO2E6]|nr:MBL fold metallo-hydrolase [Symploca sp. SIO2E6]
MKRRQLIRYTSAGLLTTLATGIIPGFGSSQAQTSNGGVTVKWLGHTCFLFTGGGSRILVNPFRTVGCTAGYRPPRVEADLVLISSQLLDEGEIEGLPGNPKILYQSSAYQIGDIKIEGFGSPHDRVGGKRFGTNVAWQWTQGGVKILHLGGAAAPIEIEQKILMGSPDVVFVPVGGGAKAYNPQEAKAAIEKLNPKLVVPTHFRTQAADEATCNGDYSILPVDEFLNLMTGVTVRRVNSDTFAIKPQNIPQQGPVIQLMSYNF